jgi:hypothetical protein
MSNVVTADSLKKSIFEGSFDTRMAIVSLYLWLLFGFLSSMVSCDLQRAMQTSMLTRHIVGVISFFFLFTIMDTNKSVHIATILVKTLFVYSIFIMMSKSKKHFAYPLLFILVWDQMMKYHIEYLEARNEDASKWKKVREVTHIAIYVLIFTGFIAYGVRQHNEFGSDFDLKLLVFGHQCRLK